MANIQRRGNSFRFTVSMGYDINGKQIRKTTTFTPPDGITEKKAQRLSESAFYEFERTCMGLSTLNENMRFSELCAWYFDNFAPNNLKDVTAYNYTSTVATHINPVFGNMKLKEITTPKMTAFYKSLNLKPITVKKIHTVMSSILHCAVKQGFIRSNPCQNAILPKIEKKEKLFLDENQAKQLLDATAEYSVFNTIIKLLLFTGMRVGECLGLQWKDIDEENCILTINHTLTYVNYKWYLSTPKTFSSRRSIKLSDSVMKILLKHKEKQKEIKDQLGDMWAQPTLVFTSLTGNFYDRSYLNKQFKDFLKANDFPPITLHDLRHCNATLLINSGVPLKIVSEHLGHCDIGITANIYAHVLEKSKAMVSEALDNVLK